VGVQTSKETRVIKPETLQKSMTFSEKATVNDIQKLIIKSEGKESL
jgi:hypothetical protein